MFLFKRHTIFLNSLWEYQSHLQCFLLSPELRLSSRASPSYFLGSGTHGQACQPADFKWGRDGCEPGITTGNSQVPAWRRLPCEAPTSTYFSSGSNSPPGASLNSFWKSILGVEIKHSVLAMFSEVLRTPSTMVGRQLVTWVWIWGERSELQTQLSGWWVYGC